MGFKMTAYNLKKMWNASSLFLRSMGESYPEYLEWLEIKVIENQETIFNAFDPPCVSCESELATWKSLSYKYCPKCGRKLVPVIPNDEDKL